MRFHLVGSIVISTDVKEIDKLTFCIPEITFQENNQQKCQHSRRQHAEPYYNLSLFKLNYVMLIHAGFFTVTVVVVFNSDCSTSKLL